MELLKQKSIKTIETKSIKTKTFFSQQLKS